MTMDELAGLRMSLILSGARAEDVEILDWAMRKCPARIQPGHWKATGYTAEADPPFWIKGPSRLKAEMFHNLGHKFITDAGNGPIMVAQCLDEGWDWITLEWCHRWLGE